MAYRQIGSSARPSFRVASSVLLQKRHRFVQSDAVATEIQNKPSDSEETKHAVVSTFDMFSIGVGPSSSHTVGPMRAGKMFVSDLASKGILDKAKTLRIDLYGSLALTGVGHATPEATLMGIEGESPETVETSTIKSRVKAMEDTETISLNGTNKIKFKPSEDLKFHYFENLPQHPNGMRCSVFDENGDMLATNEYFSIGGGFIVKDETHIAGGANVYFKGETPDALPLFDKERKEQDSVIAALPFKNAHDLVEVCERQNMTIAQVVYENELQWRSADEIREKIFRIWNTMDLSIKNGCLSTEEFLPGRLKAHRRAPILYRKLLRGLFSPNMVGKSSITPATPNPTPSAESLQNYSVSKSILPKRNVKRLSLPALDYLSVYAIAVNEENAAGGRVVTAPTNGASGVIPAVLKYYLEFLSEDVETDVMEFLFTSAAIGMLYKRGASISAAEVGCQGEVGVACSMSAAGFAAVMGGSPQQVENAAEIGMEHNLGLTCDPIDGLVQIPCIERNALGAVKAVTAAQLALNGDGLHRVTLDQVIESMRQTGLDMQSKYKETSQGGLAVNVPVC
ncbi:L-serine ammonia-lyase [Basidiobolus meristosporus CBS 931.73]|uniref:L-serine ammonia-lyase n=1 Tax=Basidiobolus meristosporus CBS 931.73 TaxID=1314790 RepID=A0A1Y1XAI9_9FUNG|nr:L-serine ammonia-lyase [Basidiobolus meristosporus CBS 931.73]|eukprot:ORX82791.1 L-serine ammonia-lyase [Basidiobolus meristosporus CBS 931.73]